MALRNLRYTGDEILRKKAKEVKKIDEKLITLLDDMAETMYEKQGVGLAAPQVGVLKRVVVIDAGDGLVELINPVILKREGAQIGFEGCLSVPGEKGAVERPEYMEVEALDRNGDLQHYELEEFYCVVFSHEIDHLDGVLYTDKIIEGYEPEEDDEEDYEEDDEEMEE